MHKPFEIMPQIDFEKCMVFFWSPGPQLFDYEPRKVENFSKNGKTSNLVVSLERKLTGGYYKTTYLMALLPTVSGDIFVFRKGNPLKQEPKLMPLHIFHDWGGNFIKFEEIVLKPEGKKKKTQKPKEKEESESSGIAVEKPEKPAKNASGTASSTSFTSGNIFPPTKPEDTLKGKAKKHPPEKINEPTEKKNSTASNDFEF
ncbi:MAG: hypothetical protein HQM08_25430 [Candidatus Riflebacteria bacterium]|nr:hypothetical protein [Candidatus Riflebacteria bacterium]